MNLEFKGLSNDLVAGQSDVLVGSSFIDKMSDVLLMFTFCDYDIPQAFQQMTVTLRHMCERHLTWQYICIEYTLQYTNRMSNALDSDMFFVLNYL